MGPTKKVMIALLSFSALAHAEFELSHNDVRQTFEEMVQFHVEHNAMNPVLMAPRAQNIC